MKRELTEEQKTFVDENMFSMSNQELCKNMKGIGPKTIQEYINSKEGKIPANECASQTTNKKKSRAAELIGRDPKRGITIMTRDASEISDMKTKIKNNAAAKNMESRIHVIKKDENE